ncbi:MAG: response regulator [Chitinivibrionales bacterium]|nr:response regulator [Chitinivibrionales bacterium]MBD3357782.1 response regulator [Chitinivibrionales bacterium]
MEQTGKGNLLIVDDEEDIRTSLRRHFSFLGYRVSVAEGGAEALEILEQERIDVVVSDIMMPGMDGSELLKAIKKDWPTIRVVIITGYVTLGNLLEVFRHGAETCVYKPLSDLSELEGAIERSFETLRIWQRKLKELKAMDPGG